MVCAATLACKRQTGPGKNTANRTLHHLEETTKIQQGMKDKRTAKPWVLHILKLTLPRESQAPKTRKGKGISYRITTHHGFYQEDDNGKCFRVFFLVDCLTLHCILPKQCYSSIIYFINIESSHQTFVYISYNN